MCVSLKFLSSETAKTYFQTTIGQTHLSPSLSPCPRPYTHCSISLETPKARAALNEELTLTRKMCKVIRRTVEVQFTLNIFSVDNSF